MTAQATLQEQREGWQQRQLAGEEALGGEGGDENLRIAEVEGRRQVQDGGEPAHSLQAQQQLQQNQAVVEDSIPIYGAPPPPGSLDVQKRRVPDIIVLGGERVWECDKQCARFSLLTAHYSYTHY